MSNTYLQLKDPGVRAAARHPALAGLPRLARGAFCAVYDKGDTVLKLTCDPVSYEFAAGAYRPRSEHFPALVEDYFCVGETSLAEPIFLFEVEKLQPIRRTSPREIKTDVSVLIEMVDVSWSKHRWATVKPTRDTVASYRALQDVAQDVSLSEPMRAALDELALFTGNYEGSLDFHNKNMMLRGDTLVLNDVIVGAEMLGKLQKKRGRSCSY